LPEIVLIGIRFSYLIKRYGELMENQGLVEEEDILREHMII
jgi:hypothetical protein